MKKSKTMRLASGLLVLTLLSTCMVAGTFAKYTSEGSGTDTARVAKWGVTVTGHGETFATAYDNADNPTVKSDTADKVVAPGTKGDMATMTLSGKPETSVKVSYKGEFDLGDGWKLANGDFYCPLVVTVKSTSGTTEIKQDGTITSAAAFNDAVNNAIAAYSKEYGPNTDLSSVATGQDGTEALTVSWSWPIGDSTTGANQTNEKDTALGDAAAKATGDTKAPSVTLAVTTTVEQID